MVAVLLVALYATAWAFEIVRGSGSLNAAGVPMVGDYIAFHTAGALVLSGRATALYDHSAVAALQGQLLNGAIAGFYDAFRNPPFLALLFVPLAALPLLLGFVVWTVLSLACLGAALWLLEARWRGLTLLTVGFAPVYFCLVDGENAALSLLLYVLLYGALRRGAEVEAGLWSALGLFKPQLFVVFPFILAARRMWRGLFAYLLSGLALALLSLALIGPNGMVAWFSSIFDSEVGNSAANAWRMASLSSLFDVALPGLASVSLALYAVCAAALLALVMWLWSAYRATPQMTWALTSVAAVLIDPHLVDYDLTVLVSAGVLLLAVDARPLHRWLAAGLYLSTLLRPELPIGGAGVLITPLVLILVLCVGVAEVQPLWLMRQRVLRLRPGAPSV